MDFKSFYRLILEKKDHLINRLEKLTDEQKKEIIDFFNRKPNLEGKIDWNNKNLTYADFEPIIKERSKTEVKKAVSKSGIAGLVEGKDYIELPLNSEKVRAYMPLNYEASRLIASDKIGGCEGKWCTAYQKTDTYWKSYTAKGIVFIYFMMNGFRYDDTKYAVAIYSDNKTIEIFNADDHTLPPESFFGILEEKNEVKDARNQIMSQTKIFDEVRKYIQEHIPLETLTEEDIQSLAEYCIRKVLNTRARGNERLIGKAMIKVETEYNSERVQNWIKQNKPTKEQIKEQIRNKISDWEELYKKILTYMGTQLDLAENSFNNKTNAFIYCDWPSIDIDGDLEDRLKKMKWSKKSAKTYGKLSDTYIDFMKLWFNELKIHSFDEIPFDWFKKWLTYNYKNNIDEFENCKENFVDDFSSAKYFNTAEKMRNLKIRPYSSILKDDQKEYINNMMDQVEKSEYSKNKQQTKLKLKL